MTLRMFMYFPWLKQFTVFLIEKEKNICEQSHCACSRVPICFQTWLAACGRCWLFIFISIFF